MDVPSDQIRLNVQIIYGINIICAIYTFMMFCNTNIHFITEWNLTHYFGGLFVIFVKLKMLSTNCFETVFVISFVSISWALHET